jgi:fatty-acyl-CoA synthase
MSTRWRWGLLEAGVQKDDRAEICTPNMAEWTLPQYATANIGASLVSINSSHRSRSSRSRTMCSWSRTS